jgi:cytidylate kinase
VRPNGILIALDGPTASGKSTTAREVALRLGYKHLNTGAMYRAFGLYVLGWGIDPSDDQKRAALLERVYIDVDENGHTLLDGIDVSQKVEVPEVAEMASRVSVFPDVRAKMVKLQKDIAGAGGFVVDGRDIGTVVFPDAEVKVYLNASAQVRAIRRHKDMLESDASHKISDIVAQIEERDRRDMERENSPLRKAKGAVEIDTTGISFDEQVEKIVKLAQKQIGVTAH